MTLERTFFDAQCIGTLMKLKDIVLHICIVCNSSGTATSKQHQNANCNEQAQNTLKQLFASAETTRKIFRCTAKLTAAGKTTPENWNT